jgi:hypothetical protein
LKVLKEENYKMKNSPNRKYSMIQRDELPKWRLHFFLGIAVVLTFMCFTLTTDLLALPAPAKIAYLEGEVLIFRMGSMSPVKAEVGMSVFYGDIVRVAKGQCQINLAASGILRLSSGTTVQFPEEDDRNDSPSVWKMLVGHTTKNFERLFPGKDDVFDVIRPTLVLGISDSYTPPQYSDAKNEQERLKLYKQFEDQRQIEIDKIRAEGNAILDKILTEHRKLMKTGVKILCPRCGNNGPHHWDGDAWSCRCGRTVVGSGHCPTKYGKYNPTAAPYRQRIEKVRNRTNPYRK